MESQCGSELSVTPPSTPLTPWTPSFDAKTFPTITLGVGTRIPSPPASDPGSETRLFAYERSDSAINKPRSEAAPLQQTQRRQLRHKRSHSHCPRGLGISNELLPLHDINDSPLRAVSPSHRPHRSVINAPISSASSDRLGKLAPLPKIADFSGVPQQDDFDIQDILVILAYKERQVLEARHTLLDAQSELEELRTRIYSMLGPKHETTVFSNKVQIITRHSQPNIGVNSLAYKPWSPPTPESHNGNFDWEVDSEVPSSSTNDTRHSEEHKDNTKPSASVRLIHCLLGIVHCIISTLPTYQARPRAQSVMRLEYPSPMATLYGFEFSLEL